MQKSRRRSTTVALAANVPKGKPACLAALGPDDELVDAALSAECNECRSAVGVALTSDKTWAGQQPIGVKPVETWEEEPMADAEALIASAMKNRG